MLLSTIATIEFVAFTASASADPDGDGLTTGLEYLINTQPNDWDSDNDQLPDGWEWKYGLDPLSSANSDGAIGDPDGDGFSNLQEYNYLQPSNWDLSSTSSVLDNGVWWNGTVPVNNWDEENSMQYNQLACGDAGSDGTGGEGSGGEGKQGGGDGAAIRRTNNTIQIQINDPTNALNGRGSTTATTVQ